MRAKVLNSLLVIGLLFSLSACTSALEKRNTVSDMDTRLDKQQKIRHDQSLGLRDDKLMVQKKVMLSEELRRIQNVAWGIQYEVYGNREYGTLGLYGSYKQCKTELNSIDMGGHGKMTPVEPAAPVINEDPELTFAKDEKGNLVGVSEEFLSSRIDRFKKYRRVLKKRRSEYETKLSICENDLKSAKKKMDKKSAAATKK